MKRRSFIKNTAAAGAAAQGAAGCAESGEPLSDTPDTRTALYSDGTLAGRTAGALRDQFRTYLFEDFLPFHYEHVIDREFGGYMCFTNHDGSHFSTDKTAWYEGRGTWTYSFLYNNIDPDPKHLETARRSIEFILRHKPAGDTLWPRRYTREGNAIAGPEAHVYGDCFIAAALAEYAKAVGDDTYWNLAKDILLKCVRIYDKDDYCPNPAGKSLGPDTPPLAGARLLSEWMVFLWVVMPLLDYRHDDEVEAIAARSIDAVLNSHQNPSFDLVNEYLNHDMTHTGSVYDQYVPPATAMETYWMIMREAVRRQDQGIFSTVAERFKRHIEFAWDDVYGGILTNCFHVDNNTWDIDRKVMWAQVEAFNGLQMIVEHTGAEWAKDWYSKLYTYLWDKWPMRQYGHPLIIDTSDRKVSYGNHTYKAELYHYPRFLMLSLLSTECILKNGGNVPDPI